MISEKGISLVRPLRAQQPNSNLEQRYLIEKENFGLPEEHPGNGNALALAPREADPALSHARGIPVRELQDEVVRIRVARALMQLLLEGSRAEG
jgi:hypothetical protein